jgi:hypothetical protein
MSRTDALNGLDFPFKLIDFLKTKKNMEYNYAKELLYRGNTSLSSLRTSI